MPPQPLQTWQHAEHQLRTGQLDAARAAYETLLSDPDWRLPGHLRLSAIALETGDLRESVAQALAGHALGEERNPVLAQALCKLLVDNGELCAALERAASPVLMQADDPRILFEVGRLLAGQSFTGQSLAYLEKARQRDLDTPLLHLLIGRARLYSGDVQAAERELELCLQAAPGHAPAWRELAKLRRQTPESNHVDALRAAITRMDRADAGTRQAAPLLHYALFKELDDLGDHAAAWQSLDTGMALHRQQIEYDVAGEQALFEHLRGLQASAERAGPADGNASGPSPIFIVGMPRSGTTLLERILGSHSQVADAGELRDFTWQLRWMCNRVGGSHLDLDLARRAEAIDWHELGRRYLSHTQWRAGGRPWYTDKLPTNFLNVGYIARALPQARILHMVREPMDTCFSNLKELFAGAYPHSYDQVEMADHYLRYRALMAHWHATFPGRILDVDYGRLVADPEAVARQVLDFCGLPWEPGVVAIESRSGAVATASAAQVRERIHARYVGQWRRYEAQLQPLRERLEAGLAQPA